LSRFEHGSLPRILHLVVINAFVGGMVGMERTVLPLLAEADFGVASRAAALSFIATFGVTKACVNFFAGTLSERWGRKPLLVLGWLVGLPVPLVLIWAPSWSWILLANVLLGVNQSLTWSMTVVMKVDLATRKTFGLVIGWNEFAGYAGVATAAAATGLVASSYGLRPEPFYLGIAFAVVGLALSLAVPETMIGSTRTGSVAREATSGRDSMFSVLARGTWADTRLSAASVSGLATNLKDGVLWGLLPLLLATRGLAIRDIGVVVGLYPLVWATSQLVFGPLSDRIGRRGLIVSGLAVQGAGVSLFALATSYPVLLLAAGLAGVGTGMVYPTLLAFVSDVAPPERRASALGVYRLWRDLGYAVGALGGGIVADSFGIPTALGLTAGLAAVAALTFAVRSPSPK
jgi:MFS family permease